MKIKILALGKLKENFLKDGIAELKKRLSPYCTFEIVEISPLQIKDEQLLEKTLDKEGEKILSLIKQTDYVITLEIKGTQLTSEEFSEKIKEISNQGIQELVFVIGSSCGLSKLVSQRADFKLSLSKMTFLHQYTRLILTEQIYRAFKIINNETYHK